MSNYDRQSSISDSSMSSHDARSMKHSLSQYTYNKNGNNIDILTNDENILKLLKHILQ